jgi:RNA polymerase sigma factor (sigma-70 family)
LTLLFPIDVLFPKVALCTLMRVPASSRLEIRRNQSRRTDADLVHAARSGNREAFAELVIRYQHLIHSLGYALTGNFNQADEICQETFLTAWRQLPTLREPDRFRGWLYGVTRLAVSVSRRKERRQVPVTPVSSSVEASLPATDPSPLERIIRDEDERALGRALGGLPETYRVPLVLFYAEQQSIESVAEALGLSPGTVRVRLSRGRAMLQEKVVELIKVVVARSRRRPTELAAAVLAALSSTEPGHAQAASSAATRTRFASSKVLTIGATVALLGTVVVVGKLFSARARADGFSNPGALAAVAPAWAARKLPVWRKDVNAAPDSGATAEAPAAPVHGAERRLFFDFEEGIFPKGFDGDGPNTRGALAADRDSTANTNRNLVESPPRQNNRFSLAGQMRGDLTYVGFDLGLDDLIEYSPDLVISFDYWVGADTSFFDVLLWEGTFLKGSENNTVQYSFPDFVRGTWAHADIRASAFTPLQPNRKPMASGDQIRHIAIRAGKGGHTPMYIDNLSITQPRP